MSAERTARILVVDDDPSVRMMLMRALELGGYAVVAVDEQLTGVYAAQAAGGPYDLIVTNEHRSPLAAETAGGVTRSGLPVLHLDELTHAGRAPMEVPGFVPFSVDALLDRVEKLLRRRAAGQH